MKTKRIPFDVEKAKNGAKVVTRTGKPVRVGFYDVKNEDYPILCLVEEDNGREYSWRYTKNGKYHKDETDNSYDLFIEEEIKTRRMTNQELSWWLREHPEEHREYCLEGETCVCFNYTYNSGYSNEEVDEHIRIRSNGGEWVIPLIEV